MKYATFLLLSKWIAIIIVAIDFHSLSDKQEEFEQWDISTTDNVGGSELNV